MGRQEERVILTLEETLPAGVERARIPPPRNPQIQHILYYCQVQTRAIWLFRCCENPMFCIKQSAVNEANPETKKNDKLSTTLPGTVQKIIKSPNPHQPEQAEIVLPDAEPLYQEIRIENTLEDKHGEEVGLKPGVPVDVTIEVDAKHTEKKTEKEEEN